MKKYSVFIISLLGMMFLFQLLTGWLMTVAYQPEHFGHSNIIALVGSPYLNYIIVATAATIAFLISNRFTVKRQ